MDEDLRGDFLDQAQIFSKCENGNQLNSTAGTCSQHGPLKSLGSCMGFMAWCFRKCESHDEG